MILADGPFTKEVVVLLSLKKLLYSFAQMVYLTHPILVEFLSLGLLVLKQYHLE